MKLPIGAGRRDQFKAALAKLGRERAADLIFAAVTQTAVLDDTPIRSGDGKTQSQRVMGSDSRISSGQDTGLNSGFNSALKPRENSWFQSKPRSWVESAGFGRFQLTEAPAAQRREPSTPAHESTFAAPVGSLSSLPSRAFEAWPHKLPNATKHEVESAESGRFNPLDMPMPRWNGSPNLPTASPAKDPIYDDSPVGLRGILPSGIALRRFPASSDENLWATQPREEAPGVGKLFHALRTLPPNLEGPSKHGQDPSHARLLKVLASTELLSRDPAE